MADRVRNLDGDAVMEYLAVHMPATRAVNGLLPTPRVRGVVIVDGMPALQVADMANQALWMFELPLVPPTHEQLDEIVGEAMRTIIAPHN